MIMRVLEPSTRWLVESGDSGVRVKVARGERCTVFLRIAEEGDLLLVVAAAWAWREVAAADELARGRVVAAAGLAKVTGAWRLLSVANMEAGLGTGGGVTKRGVSSGGRDREAAAAAEDADEDGEDGET